METNPQIELARRYIEQTSVSVFLTGKAGTGKTTFLREVAARCPKRHAIVAPTGVAAINAGGVTIHSFFQLPFDPYLPDVKELVTEYQMPERNKSLSKTKLNIIRTLELLIIDEISMVRADLLDAIDYTLRRYRKSSRPFGGVQLLLIGDVYQLSPVVTEIERPYMERVYPTPYFFASKALQRIPYVTIELTTVYRQQDSTFVNLLNHVRDNRLDADTLSLLNARVSPQLPTTHYQLPTNLPITLTTHNRQADTINRRQMEALKGERRVFEAELSGNYPEKSLPCDRTLEVKVGERVMFVKNDSSGAHRYYNGMLGTVTGFVLADNEEATNTKESIEVINDDGDIIVTGRETWESLKYTLNSRTNEIEQEVEGTFSQYPLQAAWAVTIHKAQGLTFDRVVIDAADAFAFGQVYVALSRCRTLEGLTLSTPLNASVAFNDLSVSHFVNSQPSFEQTAQAAESYERQYRLDKLIELFGVDDLLLLTERLLGQYTKLRNIYPDNLASLNAHHSTLLDLQSVSEKFKKQLMRLDEQHQDARARQAAEYYLSQLALYNAHLPAFLEVEIDNKETAKAVANVGAELTEAMKVKVSCLRTVKEQGFSVPAVQQARVDALMGREKSTRRSRRSTPSTKQEEVPAERGQKRASAQRTPIPPKQSGDSDIDNDLATLLRQWRLAKAREEGIPPYVVLQQKALQAIATNMPRTPQELKRQLGIGPKTIEKYGNEILEIVLQTVGDGDPL